MLGGSAALATRLRSYGSERIPRSGGVVFAFNHFHWIDIPCFGWVCKRHLYYLAKVEAHRVPGLGAAHPQLRHVRRCGAASPTARPCGGCARSCARENALGVFVEGTRQRSGVPGHVQPGAAMVGAAGGRAGGLRRDPRLADWKVGNFAPVSIAWGEPMRFEGLPRGGKGYREASAQIEAELYRLWAWLRDLHEAGRPRHQPPTRDDAGAGHASA